ncbi:MAG: hypothetical protein ACUVQ8_08130, partial [Nitrososphaeria archaeon]
GVQATSVHGTALMVDGKGRCYATVNDWQPGAPYSLPSAFSVLNDAEKKIEKPHVAIVGYAPKDIGIAGFSDDNFAVHGNSTNNAGVYGFSFNDKGVWGWSKNGDGVAGMGRCKGVAGISAEGIGVYGESETGFGVLAISNHSPALRVEGKSSFSTVGSGIIPRLKKSFTVNVASGLLKDKSHVSVTLTSDPTVLGGDAAISWIQRDPANNRFTINLTKTVGRDTTFTYFIVEP